MGNDEEANGPSARLSQEQMERHIARVTAPPRPVMVCDPFPLCPAPKVSQDQIDKMTDRLYTQSIEQREANRKMLDMQVYRDVGPQKTIDADNIAESATRMHDQAIEQKKTNMVTLKDKFEYKRKDPKPVPLKKFVEHMYTDRIEKKKKTEERLYEKYIAPTEINTGWISLAQAKASGDRLSTK